MRYIQYLIITLALSTCFTQLNAQCSSGAFNCNDTIQVSVDVMCQAVISADIILEQPNTSCNYEILFFDMNDSLINVPNNTVNINHVGQTIKVKVREAGVSNPNSCWGYIKVEDKIPAIIECPEFEPLKCLDSDENDPGRTDEILKEFIKREILQSSIQDNCKDTATFVVSIVRNQLQQLICSDQYGAQRIIKYNLIGFDGRVLLMCEDTLVFDKFDTDNVDPPVNFIGSHALECDGTWKTGQTWEVYPDSAEQTWEVYPDSAEQTWEVYPDSAEQTWEVYPDSAELEKFGIIIYPSFKELFKLKETSFPSIDGRAVIKYDENLEAFVRVGFCNINAAFTDLPPFEVCGNSYKLIRSWTIIDWCKQSEPKIYNQIIEVKDSKAPVFSVPSIPPQDAGVNTCNMLVELPKPEVTWECSDWTYCLEFKYPGTDIFVAEPEFQGLDLSDVLPPKIFPIGTTTVKYIVKDVCGNLDSVKRDVVISDGQAPIAICDTRVVVNLNNNEKGKIFYQTIDDKSFDNCTENLVFKIWRKDGRDSLNAPDSSFVKFDWADVDQEIRVMMQVSDEGGLKSSCWTTVEVRTNNDGKCPAQAATLDICTNYTSDNIGDFLTIPDGLIAEVIASSDNICEPGFVIVQWTDTSRLSNVVLCTQTFTRIANPVSLSDIAMPQDVQFNVCDATEPTEADMTDILDVSIHCTAEVWFKDVVFSEKIFRTWTVTDLCTGVPLDQYTQIIEIVPTDISNINIDEVLQCPHYGVTFQIGAQGSVTISALDLNDVPDDVCTDGLDIRIRRSTDDLFTETVTFTCDDIADTIVYDVELALFDNDGNILDTCSTLILVDDQTSQVCPPSGSNVNIAGTVFTEERVPVENVSILLLNENNQRVGEFVTSADGEYAFNNKPNTTGYRLTTNRNDVVINGVSTLDLLLIQRHIVGLRNLESPYKVIAADINNNGSVSAADLVQLRKLILGISDTYPNNESWRFIDARQTFDDINNPWPFAEIKDVLPGQNDFIGVKIGDVDLNAVANSLVASPRTSHATELIAEDIAMNKGEISRIALELAEPIDLVSAYQIKLNYDDKRIKLRNIYDFQGKPLGEEDYWIKGNTITIASIMYKADKVLFALELEALVSNASTSDIISLGSYSNEWYSETYDTYRIVKLSFKKSEPEVNIRILPNPFTDQTTLEIHSEKAQSASLKIFDIQGREVSHNANLKLSVGKNHLIIRSSEISDYPGLYIYSLQIGKKNLRGKLIYLD